jgi:FKBP-type peptidyl-prolyl cis-trans isomerase FkpA
MKKIALYSLLFALAAAGCSKNIDYRTAKSGMLYKIISGSSKDSLKQGDLLKVFLEQRFEDSIMNSSREMGHQMVPYDTNFAKQTYFVTEVLPFMKPGDSAVCKLSTDTILKRFFKDAPPEQIPPYMKPGKSIYFYVKIVKKYTDSAEFKKDGEVEAVLAKAYGEKMQKKQMEEQQKQMAEMQKKAEEQKKKDAPLYVKCREDLDKFLGAKRASLIKTAGGAYVEILQPGSGPACEPGKMVDVRYRGTLLNGKEFDGNMSAAGAPTAGKPAYTVTIGQPGAIQGFMEGVAALRKGARAKVYIPSDLGYGNSGSGPDIKPFDNLIFELYIENVSAPRTMADVQTAPAADPNAKPGQQ